MDDTIVVVVMMRVVSAEKKKRLSPGTVNRGFGVLAVRGGLQEYLARYAVCPTPAARG